MTYINAMTKLIPSPGSSTVIDPKNPIISYGVTTDADQKKLKALIERRHPDFEELVNHWHFLEDTYEGGREWFDKNVFRYIKEGDTEFKDRLKRCYRFNHSREVVDLLNKYLFKQHIVRNEDDAPAAVKEFWNRATKSGLSMRDFSRQVSKKTSIYGRIGVVVDSTYDGSAISKADEKEKGGRIYAYTIGPQQLLDYSYDDDGELRWALVQECFRDDEDPIESSGAEENRYRLWTKTGWQLYKVNSKNGRVTKLEEREHDLGVVPIILADNIISDEEYSAPALIDDIAYLDRAVANYLSNLDAIIQDQTFSQLTMPAQNVLPGEDSYTKMVEMGTKRVFLFDGEGGGKPEYISPDPKQAQMILAVINKIINEIYHTVGLAGERTKQDNALGIDNSSGVAKAYDFERVNALLQAKADSLEVFENRIIKLVALYAGETGEVDNLVTYPDNFDTRGLYDEFDIAARLNLIEAPDSVKRHQMTLVIDKLFPQLAKNLKEKMLEDLKEWPVDPIEFAKEMAEATMTGSGATTSNSEVEAQKALSKSANRDMAKVTLSQN